MDTILCHPREVFRLAIMASASAIVIAHIIPAANQLHLKRTLKSPVTSFERASCSRSKSSITSSWDIPTTHHFVNLDIFCSPG
jgi:hypothetical protein